MATICEEEIMESDESLIALTTHFAQVQFRLKQIISAEPEHKEGLLKDLEKFAFQGCGKPMTYDTAASGENGSTEAQRRVRIEIMEKLRNQLDDIEKCAQEATKSGSGDTAEAIRNEDGVLNTMAEKQRIIIDELRKRFDFQFGDLERLSAEEVKLNVGKAVKEVVDPIKSHEEYVMHLQGQIKDLERYITFLQAKQKTDPETDPDLHDLHEEADAQTKVSSSRHRVTSKHVTFAEDMINNPISFRHDNPPPPLYRLSMTQLDGVECSVDSSHCEWEKRDSLRFSHINHSPDDLRLSLAVMRRTLAVMQILTFCQCGGSLQCLPKYVADGKRKRYQLALNSLELAVDKIAIITTALREVQLTNDSRISLETDLHETVSMLLADSLRILIEHGLLAYGQPVSLTGGCFPAWKNWGFSGHGIDKNRRDCPAWRVFIYYFNLKNGKKYSSKTEQLLSTSFALPIDSNSVKKTLLSSINKVDHTYDSSLHYSSDTKFRAFVCEGFNLCHLSDWFKVLASHPSIGEDLYAASSFLTTTGFRPAIACLERLKDNPPCEPVTLPQYTSEDAFLRS